MSTLATLPLAARWPAPVATLVVWGLAAASITFWALRLSAPAESVAPPAVASAPPVVDPVVVGRLLGAVDASTVVVVAPEAASRFALLGVIADSDGQGAALIAVDGKPARPFRVGAALADGYVLQSVGARAATVGGSAQGPAAFTLQLPARPMAIPGPAPTR